MVALDASFPIRYRSPVVLSSLLRSYLMDADALTSPIAKIIIESIVGGALLVVVGMFLRHIKHSENRMALAMSKITDGLTSVIERNTKSMDEFNQSGGQYREIMRETSSALRSVGRSVRQFGEATGRFNPDDIEEDTPPNQPPTPKP